MDADKQNLTKAKYRLPYHWIRDPDCRESLPYFGYIELAAAALPAPPAKVLDAGCGDGRISAELMRRGYDVTGVDFFEHLVEYARLLNERDDFHRVDLTQPIEKQVESLELGTFDAAILIEVFEHLPPEACPAALDNLLRSLKPGGTLIVSVPSLELPMSKLHYRHFGARDFREELEAAGFKVDRMLRQHRLGGVTRKLLSPKLDRVIENGWVEPTFLKRLRRKLYMRFVNEAPADQPCGRYLAVCRKPAANVTPLPCDAERPLKEAA